MNRRTLLLGSLAFTTAQMACRSNVTPVLQIAALKGAIPSQAIAPFKAQLANSARLRIQSVNTIAELFQQLQVWQLGENLPHNLWPLRLVGIPQSSAPPSWVNLNDYWLRAAIQGKLIQPLDKSLIQQLESQPLASTTQSAFPDWKTLLQRNAQGFLPEDSNSAALWATPYRWGSLVMVYSQRAFQRLGWSPTQWQDLWRSDLAGQVSLPSHPRLTLGIILKSLGYSVNDPAPQTHRDFLQKLDALSAQVNAYAVEDYVQPLIQGDLALAVGWSTDIRPLVSQYQQLQAVIPDPGTILSADVWVRPNSPNGANASETNPVDPPLAELSELDTQWVSYWWSSEVQPLINRHSDGLSPNLLGADPAVTIASEQLLLPSPEQIGQSEFLYPLSAAAVREYEALWQRLRRRE